MRAFERAKHDHELEVGRARATGLACLPAAGQAGMRRPGGPRAARCRITEIFCQRFCVGARVPFACTRLAAWRGRHPSLARATLAAAVARICHQTLPSPWRPAQPSGFTWLHLDHRHMGVGGDDSWSPTGAALLMAAGAGLCPPAGLLRCTLEGILHTWGATRGMHNACFPSSHVILQCTRSTWCPRRGTTSACCSSRCTWPAAGRQPAPWRRPPRRGVPACEVLAVHATRRIEIHFIERAAGLSCVNECCHMTSCITGSSRWRALPTSTSCRSLVMQVCIWLCMRNEVYHRTQADVLLLSHLFTALEQTPTAAGLDTAASWPQSLLGAGRKFREHRSAGGTAVSGKDGTECALLLVAQTQPVGALRARIFLSTT